MLEFIINKHVCLSQVLRDRDGTILKSVIPLSDNDAIQLARQLGECLNTDHIMSDPTETAYPVSIGLNAMPDGRTEVLIEAGDRFSISYLVSPNTLAELAHMFKERLDVLAGDRK